MEWMESLGVANAANRINRKPGRPLTVANRNFAYRIRLGEMT